METCNIHTWVQTAFSCRSQHAIKGTFKAVTILSYSGLVFKAFEQGIKKKGTNRPKKPQKSTQKATKIDPKFHAPSGKGVSRLVGGVPAGPFLGTNRTFEVEHTTLQ
jgi:hypothetical protein